MSTYIRLCTHFGNVLLDVSVFSKVRLNLPRNIGAAIERCSS